MNLNIRNRLLAGIGVVIFIVLLMTGWVVYSSQQSAEITTMANRSTKNTMDVKDYVYNVRNGRVMTWHYVALARIMHRVLTDVV